MALTNMSISFSKSHQQVSLLSDDHSDTASNCPSTQSTPSRERKSFIQHDTKAQNDLQQSRSRASSNLSLNSTSTTAAVSPIQSPSNESLSVQELISKDKLISEEIVNPINEDGDTSNDKSLDGSSVTAEQAEEALDALLDEDPKADNQQNQSDVSIISHLWPWLTSPSAAITVIVFTFMLTRFNADFLLGALTATIVSPLIVYLLVRYLLFSKSEEANYDDPSSADYLETATRSDNEISGWMYVKEGKERKPVYVRLRGRELKLSYKDTTSKLIEITIETRLQLVSPYTKSKKRLKHLFNKNLPIVITDKGEQLVLFFREAKQKETWFWSLYPLFYPYDAEQLLQKNVAAQQQLASSGSTKSNNNSIEQRDWFNLLLSRAFRDLLSHFKWRRWVRRKCQQKLRRLPLPQFIDPLRVRKVTLSSQFPRLSNPTGHRDGEGQAQFSFELDASPVDGEESVFEMTLETKINASFFTNYKEDDGRHDNEFIGLSDDEEEEQEVSFDTVSSSSEDEDEQFEQLPLDGEPLSMDEEALKTSQSTDSFISEKAEKERSESNVSELSASPSSNQLSKMPAPKTFLDKLRVKGSVILSKNKTVRKYFDELVSSSQLTLTVKVLSLKGRLLLAQPSWPSDRVWFKMAPRPELKLSVHLKHGNHQKPLIRSTWLKNQLEERLRRHLVQVMCTFDDVALHPLLVLPSTRFYAVNRQAQALGADGSLFRDRL